MGDDQAAPNIAAKGNHVYFYAGIDDQSTFQLITTLRDVDASNVWQAYNDDSEAKPIYLHINSPGGAVTDTFAIVDTIQSLKSPTVSIVEGIAASGGSLISVSCQSRLIRPRALMLVHQLSGWAVGTYEQIKDETTLMDKLMATIVEVYTSHSKQKKSAIRKMLKRDTWLTAKEAVELGFADKIIEG